MSETVRAKRAEIELGDFTLEVFQLPNGDYRLSQSQVAEIVEKDETLVRRFSTSKSPEALPYKGLTLGYFDVEDERTRVKGVPIDLAVAFWTKEAVAKNAVAARLLGACAIESLEKRADKAFGIHRTDADYNDRLKRNFEDLKLIVSELEYLERYSEDSQVFDSETYDLMEPILQTELKYPVCGMSENEIRDELAILSNRTDQWKLKIEDELEFIFEGQREYSYPDLTSGVFSATIETIDSKGLERHVVFIFECKNPIIGISDIKECLYDRKYLEAARAKYKTEHVFLFMVAPYGGVPLAHQYVKHRLSPDDVGYVRILRVKQLAQFLKEQVIVTNPQKKGEITKRFRELLNYPIQLAPMGFQKPSSQKRSKKQL